MSQNKAYTYLIKLLSSRDYSEHKLREKLRTRDYPANEINEAIEEVKKQNYLREDLYAEARVKGFLSKGYSHQFIKQKLSKERVSVESDFIEGISKEYKYSEEDQLKDLISKKMRYKTSLDFAQEVKITRFLITKGHDYNAIKKALAEFKKPNESLGYSEENI